MRTNAPLYQKLQSHDKRERFVSVACFVGITLCTQGMSPRCAIKDINLQPPSCSLTTWLLCPLFSTSASRLQPLLLATRAEWLRTTGTEEVSSVCEVTVALLQAVGISHCSRVIGVGKREHVPCSGSIARATPPPAP